MAKLRGSPCAIYEFGVYTGGGAYEWLQLARESNLLPCELWGFDSFQGLPDEDKSLKYTRDHNDPGWNAGGINAADAMGVHSWAALSSQLKHNIKGDLNASVHLVRGFFNESLADGAHMVQRRHMPAPLLIDLDCDLYVSSMQALRFVLEAKLLQVGTYLYLDDVSWQFWESRHNDPKAQTLAFMEMTRTYGLKWFELMDTDGANNHMWRPILRLDACELCGK